MADNNNNRRILRPRAEINYFPRRRLDRPNDDNVPDRPEPAGPNPNRRGGDLPVQDNPPPNPEPRLDPQANDAPVNPNPLVEGGPRINPPNIRDPRLNPANRDPRFVPEHLRDPGLNPRPQLDIPAIAAPDPEPARVPNNDELFQERFNPVPAELHPRPTRVYGVRPRGVILRIRDPPQWTRTAQGKQLLREMNRQGLFDGEIDEAYRVPAPQPVLSRFTKMCNFFYSLSNRFNKLEIGLLCGLCLYMIYMFHTFAESLKTYYFIKLEKS